MTGYTAYIDESGCDGFEFDKGATDFLVIGAVISRTSNLGQFAVAVEAARREAGKPKGWTSKSFKKLKNSDAQRWLFAKHLSATKCQTVAVCVHKESLQKEGWQENKEDLYFHASKLLIERISWACRDTNKVRPENDPRCHIIFSNRTGLRYPEFQKYMATIKSNPLKYETKADWRFIDPSLVDSEVHDDSNPCHLAIDHFASGIGLALEHKMYGMFDDRFARIWSSRYYGYKGRSLNNGLKFWPPEGFSLVKDQPRGGWITLCLK